MIRTTSLLAFFIIACGPALDRPDSGSTGGGAVGGGEAMTGGGNTGGGAATSGGTAGGSATSGGTTGGGSAGGTATGGGTAGGTPDAGAQDAGVTCIENNSSSAIADRGGFIEECATAAAPRAVCGDGSPYRFSHRPASGVSQGLLLFFMGGGGCGDYVSCFGLDGMGGPGVRVAQMKATFVSPPYVALLNRHLGVFNTNETLNPFSRFDTVFVTYCTGDVGLQSTERVLNRPANASPTAPATIQAFFHGNDNVAFALSAARQLYPTPGRIAVVGSSAGGYSLVAHMDEVVATWPTVAAINAYSEGAVGVGRPLVDMPAMLRKYNGADGGPFVRFTAANFMADESQVSFAPPPYNTNVSQFTAEMRRMLEHNADAGPTNYRYLALPGTCHVALQSLALFQQFTQTADGGWRPVTPAVKPNPDLSAEGVNVVDLLQDVATGTGAFTRPNAAGSWTTPRLDCPLP